MKHLLLLGGGHAHAFLLRCLIGKALHGVRVTLVTPYPRHTYSGMLPGLVAGHYAEDEIRIDVETLARRAGAAFAIDSVTTMNAGRRSVRLESGAELAYDFASLNIGSLPDYGRTPGAAQYATPVKPFETFLARWTALRREAGERRLRLAVVGAGAGGIELSMAMAHALPKASVALYSDRNMFDGVLARRIGRALDRMHVELRAGAPVSAVEAGPVLACAGGRERYDFAAWTAGAAPLPWLRDSGLATDERGFVSVDATLRSVSHPEVFAVGDAATLASAPHPKSGVYAVRHGALLARNLPAALEGGGLESYAPQRRALALLSCGARRAIASWGSLSAEGAWAWRWKDRLDRNWVAQYRA